MIINIIHKIKVMMILFILTPIEGINISSIPNELVFVDLPEEFHCVRVRSDRPNGDHDIMIQGPSGELIVSFRDGRRMNYDGLNSRFNWDIRYLNDPIATLDSYHLAEFDLHFRKSSTATKLVYCSGEIKNNKWTNLGCSSTASPSLCWVNDKCYALIFDIGRHMFSFNNNSYPFILREMIGFNKEQCISCSIMFVIAQTAYRRSFEVTVF